MPRHLRTSIPAFILSVLLLGAGLLPVSSASAEGSNGSMEGPADQQAPIDQNNPDNPGGQNNRGQKPGDQNNPGQQPGDQNNNGQKPGDQGGDQNNPGQQPGDQGGGAEKPGEPAEPTGPQTVSADALPTAQIGDGVVWDQEVVGNTVYVAGTFSSARPAGAAAGESEQSRSNLMAYDITTGELLDWAPTTDGNVQSITASPDGSTLYIGGNFTKLNGANTYRVGAVSAAASGWAWAPTPRSRPWRSLRTARPSTSEEASPRSTPSPATGWPPSTWARAR